MLLSSLCAIVFAALNWARGRDYLPRPACAGAMAIFYELVLCWGMPLVPVLGSTFLFFLLMWLGLAPGVGKYFAAFNGRYDLGQKEFWLSDLAADKYYVSTGNGHLAGLLGMTLRGTLFIPAFLALGLLHGWDALLGVPAALLMGPCYYVMRYIPEKWAVPCAEVLFGAVLGLTTALVVGL